MTALVGVTAVVYVAEINDLFPRSLKDNGLVFLSEFFPGFIDIKTIMRSERLEHMEIVKVASVPPANSAFR